MCRIEWFQSVEVRYPDDMEDGSMLVPVDVSGEPEDFPTTPEELTAKATAVCTSSDTPSECFALLPAGRAQSGSHSSDKSTRCIRASANPQSRAATMQATTDLVARNGFVPRRRRASPSSAKTSSSAVDRFHLWIAHLCPSKFYQCLLCLLNSALDLIAASRRPIPMSVGSFAAAGAVLSALHE